MKLSNEILNHIYDQWHVDFDRPKLNEYLKFVRTDGTHVFETAGVKLKLVVKGPWCQAFRSTHEKRWNRWGHEYSKVLVRYSGLVDEFCGGEESVIENAIFGKKLPSGVAASFVQSMAWVYFGEDGLRAEAERRRVKAASKFNQGIAYDQSKLQENIAFVTSLRKPKALETEHKKRLAKFVADLPEVETKEPEVFYRVSAQYSPSLTPRYTVSINPFKLSSGVAMPDGVTIESVRAWLAGETPAPNTLYGPLRLEEGRHDFKPVKLISVGCHHIRFDHIPELAPFSVPTHEVVTTPGLPSGSKSDADPTDYLLRLSLWKAKQTKQRRINRVQTAKFSEVTLAELTDLKKNSAKKVRAIKAEIEKLELTKQDATHNPAIMSVALYQEALLSLIKIGQRSLW